MWLFLSGCTINANLLYTLALYALSILSLYSLSLGMNYKNLWSLASDSRTRNSTTWDDCTCWVASSSKRKLKKYDPTFTSSWLCEGWWWSSSRSSSESTWQDVEAEVLAWSNSYCCSLWSLMNSSSSACFMFSLNDSLATFLQDLHHFFTL